MIARHMDTDEEVPSHVAEKNRDSANVKRQTQVTEVLNIKSLRPELRELERALMWGMTLGGDSPEMIPVVVSVASSGKKKCNAWTVLNMWKDREGDEYHEVQFTAEQMHRDPVDVVATAIHEDVHLFCSAMGIKDCSKGGRHNQQFKEMAEVFGLVCDEPYDSAGYGHTRPSEALRQRIEKEFKPDIAALNLARKVAEKKDKEKKPSKTKAYECLCMTVRVAQGKTLRATCDECEQPFILKEGQDDAQANQDSTVEA